MLTSNAQFEQHRCQADEKHLPSHPRFPLPVAGGDSIWHPIPSENKMIPLPTSAHASTNLISGNCSDDHPTSGRLLSSAKQKLLHLAILAFVLTLGVPSILRAQTCPSDIEPPTPPQEQLAAAYQPSAYDPNDHTVLRRLRFVPPTGGPKWPTVLTIHPGGFRDGDDHGSPHQRLADYDLANLAQAGFLVFSIEHRLAPPNTLFGQHSHDGTALGIASGRPPQQSNDVKQQILAALADGQCNGTIFLIGASSGGTHALWAALDPNPTVPGWSSASFPKAVVGLSGIYDLSLRTPPPSQQFIADVNNYTNTIDNFVGLEYQYSTSPISLVVPYATNQTAPARLYTTDGDPVPWQAGGEHVERFGA